jgi:beta-N-acetylhexosaminidase
MAIYNEWVPLPVRHEIGQLMIGSLPGTTVPPEFRSLVREFGLGGVTLFGRNVEGPEQVADLACEVRALVHESPLWVAVDQEGGRVSRLRAPFTEWPPMAALGRSGDDGLCARFGRSLGAELRAVGITLNYAPVLDVRTNPHSPIIGDRALAEDAEVVARMGAIIIAELQRAGVAACGKHFPGHGDTSVDSHLALPVVDHSPDRIRQVECVPFAVASAAGVAFMMTAHILVPSMDADRPATLSSAVVAAVLRQELGFEGVILSDDIEMRALADRWPRGEAAVAAIAAGCDGVLLCRAVTDERASDLDAHWEVLEALVYAVEDGRIPHSRFEDAVRRQQRARARFLTGEPVGPKAWRTVVGSEAHQRVADELKQHT